ncbi:MAG TPA: succinate dehydrogenase cytochrome b subunit [Fibrobacteria bacterium]|nr:succinate dehydrogenase cytochrome b subunit [Fibrobacteria bacterium]
MTALRKYATSSIGRKQIMGASGIALYGFLLVHLVGNLAFLSGPERLNQYGHLLLHTLAEITLPAEIGLLLIFVLHVGLAISLKRDNRAARPVPYAVAPNHGKKTLYSSTMMISGLVIAAFVLVHISHFRFGAGGKAYMAVYDGIEMRDLYRTSMEWFAQWWYSLAYVAVFVLLASHLAHGVQSSLQTLGFNHPKYRAAVHWLSRGYAVVICGGFASLAIWAYFSQGGAR